MAFATGTAVAIPVGHDDTPLGWERREREARDAVRSGTRRSSAGIPRATPYRRSGVGGGSRPPRTGSRRTSRPSTTHTHPREGSRMTTTRIHGFVRYVLAVTLAIAFAVGGLP